MMFFDLAILVDDKDAALTQARRCPTYVYAAVTQQHRANRNKS